MAEVWEWVAPAIVGMLLGVLFLIWWEERGGE